MTEKPVSRPLPAPRIQLRWMPSTVKRDYNWECHYELVLPLDKHDIRRDVCNDDGEVTKRIKELVVAMKSPSLRNSSETPCGPCKGQDSRYYDAPYRDGAHAQWDATLLGGLPIYVIAPDGEAFLHEPTKD